MKSVAVKTATAKAAEAAPTVEATGHIATMESAAPKASTAMKAAATKAATMETATATHAASVAAASSTTCQGHGWRSQANGRDCQ